MSKLEELIKEFCLNGVDYKKLGELGKFYGGLSGKSKNDFTNGNEKFITYKNVYANPSLNLDIEDRVKINPGERQNTLQYGDIIFTGSSETPDECGFSSVITTKTSEKLYLNSFCFFFRLDNQSILLPDFAKHLFRAESIRYQIGKTASGVTRYNVSKDKMKQVQIPLPALPVQREIVRILDSFTLYSAELTAELTARRKQYEFYRDKLLLGNGIGVQEITILDMLSQPITDGPHETPEFVNEGVPFLSAEAIVDNRLDFSRKRGNVTKEYDLICARKYKPRKGDVFMCKSGSTTGKVAINDTDIDFNIWSPLAAMRVNSNHSAKFLYYLLQSADVQNQVKMNASHGSQPNLSMRKLEQFRVKVPPMEVQERIVKVLDNFDAICSDLGIGLPAEIEKRQKQYEYYREKLLTFDGKYETILTERNGTERNGQG